MSALSKRVIVKLDVDVAVAAHVLPHVMVNLRSTASRPCDKPEASTHAGSPRRQVNFHNPSCQVHPCPRASRLRVL